MATVLERIRNYQDDIRRLESELREKRAELTEFCGMEATRAQFVEEQFPEMDALVYADESDPKTYTRLNKMIPAWDRDPFGKQWSLPPTFEYEIKMIWGNHLRRKRSRIRLLRKRARK